MSREIDHLDRIIDRYSGRLPPGLARFVAWLRKPELRWMRLAAGVFLVFFGLLGFLPVLGFWMVPLGLLLLAQDIPFLRRPIVSAIYYVERKISAWRRSRRG